MPRPVVHTLIAIKSILKLITTAPHSVSQLAAVTGFTENTLYRHINYLHKDYPENLIYISSYRRHSEVGPWTAYYSWGPGRSDVAKPPLKPVNQRTKDYRKRQKVLALTAKSLVLPSTLPITTVST